MGASMSASSSSSAVSGVGDCCLGGHDLESEDLRRQALRLLGRSAFENHTEEGRALAPEALSSRDETRLDPRYPGVESNRAVWFQLLAAARASTSP